MIILTQRRRERRGPAEILLSRWLVQGGRGVEVTDPTPRYAHPSPTMGGEVITTSACNYAPVSIVQNFCYFRYFCGTKKQLFCGTKKSVRSVRSV